MNEATSSPTRVEHEVNVPSTERVASAAIGAALVLAGLRRGSVGGLLIAGLGGLSIRRGVSGHCSAYAALGVNRAKGEGAQPSEYSQRGIHVSESTTIQKSPTELYQYWRDFKNLPHIMTYLESVQVIDDKRSKWTAKAPAGTSVAWEAELINDVPGEVIAWRSLYPATVDNAGSVRFAEGPSGGTEVTVTLDYIPPAGVAGWIIAKLFGRDPAAEIREDLRRFKSTMEAGEAPTIKGQPHGERGMVGSMMATD